MPELPEVETIASTLRPQILGKRITCVDVLLPKSVQAGKELLAAAVPGMTISRVFRRAKLLMLELTREKAGKNQPAKILLAFHLKMTGSFFVHPEGADPLKHTRLIFSLENGDSARASSTANRPTGRGSSKKTAQAEKLPESCRLFFDDTRTFGYCRAMLPEELEQWDFWANLGPEPLETAPTELAACLGRSRAAIKAALLDQGVVAGVGNIYADESLFQARIHPQTKTNSLPAKRLNSLAKVLQAILQKSIEECGSSIRDYKDALGNAGAFQNSFSVYGRKGEACLHCGRPLETQKVAGRTTTFCPHCQKK